jgi:5-hydroxyisourate hydrolase/2-oxo-4-hydroxy-4-carboxy-5-ureidoimidazoline decarboxylase
MSTQLNMITLESKDILGCCASKTFSALLAARSPFHNLESVLDAAHDIWWNEVSVPDWLEAFRAHPRIGDASALRHSTDKFSSYSKSEQSVALQGTTSQVQQELVEWNKKYEKRFGHIFLIFAAGKSSAEILATLRERYVILLIL